MRENLPCSATAINSVTAKQLAMFNLPFYQAVKISDDCMRPGEHYKSRVYCIQYFVKWAAAAANSIIINSYCRAWLCFCYSVYYYFVVLFYDAVLCICLGNVFLAHLEKYVVSHVLC